MEGRLLFKFAWQPASQIWKAACFSNLGGRRLLKFGRPPASQIWQAADFSNLEDRRLLKFGRLPAPQIWRAANFGKSQMGLAQRGLEQTTFLVYFFQNHVAMAHAQSNVLLAQRIANFVLDIDKLSMDIHGYP